MILALSLLACVKAPGPSTASVAPSSNVWLRNGFDTDASSYVGRFVPAGAVELDESSAMALACSRFVTSRFVEGGGVRYAEVVQVSAEAGARVGIPVIGSADAAGSGARLARVEYTLTGKLVSEVTDPVGFAECCKTSPDQCSDRYIGEFLQGTGAVYHSAKSSGGGAVDATHPTTGVSAEVSVGASQEWTRAVEFPTPVYFAFKVTQTPYTQQAVSTCPAWVTAPPTTTDGVMIVGQSKELTTEEAARRGALRNAWSQVWTTIGSTDVYADTGGAAITAKEWCVQPRTAGGETRYVGHVLVHVPQSSVDAMRVVARQRQAEAAAAAVPSAPGPSGATAPGGATQPMPPPPQAPSSVGRMDDAEVTGLVATMKGQSFSADQLHALSMGTAGRTLTVAQAAALVEVLSFSADRIAALRSLRPAIVDPQAAAQLLELFPFSTDKAAVEAIFR